MSAVPRKLLVEGETEKRVIPYLMEANGVAWPREPVPVNIESQGGVDQILRPGVIEAELRARGVDVLGVIVDGDRDAAARWRAIRDTCESEFDDLPADIPEGGLNVVHQTGVRFGVWIMPDNRFVGMLKDLLLQLLPAESESLLDLARECVSHASRSGAPFKETHRTKAEIHTWLAWQDEPGKQLHEAVHHRVLDPQRPESGPFVKWFRALFSV